jgi:transketolase
VNSVDLARAMRIDVLNMTHLGNSSHIGSCLSVTDILAVLYAQVLRVNPQDPLWHGRDRFIMSKGHAGAAVYSVLARTGFFRTAMLDSHCSDGSLLSGHVSHVGVPGVEFSTGSLGHGLGVGTGRAWALRTSTERQRVFVLLSDGELDEGSVWEAALFAAHHQLSNLIAIVDYNKLQSISSPQETLGLEPLRAKWEAFGWKVLEVDGHDHDLMKAVFSSDERSQPLIVIAHTVKGRGVSFMENKVLWHYRSPQGEEFQLALRELEA